MGHKNNTCMPTSFKNRGNYSMSQSRCLKGYKFWWILFFFTIHISTMKRVSPPSSYNIDSMESCAIKRHKNFEDLMLPLECTVCQKSFRPDDDFHSCENSHLLCFDSISLWRKPIGCMPSSVLHAAFCGGLANSFLSRPTWKRPLRGKIWTVAMNHVLLKEIGKIWLVTKLSVFFKMFRVPPTSAVTVTFKAPSISWLIT